MQTTVLVVEDDLTLVRMFQHHLNKWGYDMITANTGAEYRECHNLYSVDTILLDVNLPDADGIELLEEVRRRDPNVPVVIMTAYGTIERAIRAMKLGAYDFVTKPIEWAAMEVTIKNAIERNQLTRQVSHLQQTLGRRRRFHNLIGASKKMQALYSVIENVAPSNISVMITGESGTGKELVAQAIHAFSPRRDREIVDVNCAAIPREMMESELFGHERGAFTGALQRRIGCCERAHQSTLFLDEICEMDIGLQSKLLRFLQERYFHRIGGKDKITVDTRVISASNRNPWEEVEAGRFREDLYYRLNVVMIHVPPLRERRDDIPLLARHFLQLLTLENKKQFEDITDQANEVLCEYDWPGNVRELHNVISHIVALHSGGQITVDMLPDTIVHRNGQRGSNGGAAYYYNYPVNGILGGDSFASPKLGYGNGHGVVSLPVEASVLPLTEVERIAIEHALRLFCGNVPEVCHQLGISQATLYRKVKEYNLKIADFRNGSYSV